MDMVIRWCFYESPKYFEKTLYKRLRGRKGYNRLLKDIANVEPLWGSDIASAVEEMVDRSDLFGIRTYIYFNDVYLVCNPGDLVESLTETYRRKWHENSEKYRRSFHYLLSQRKMEEGRKDNEKRREIVQGWMKEDKMKIKFFRILQFRKMKKKNQTNSYSKRVVSYAEKWAVGMQRAIKNGKEISDVADELSHFVDYNGITGFMYGCAAGILSHYWKYGKEFRHWFNLQNQISDEGEKATKKGRILNPAVLHIVPKE